MAQSRTEIQSRYDAKNTQRYSIKLNNKTDTELINKLAMVDSVQGYIRGLIRQDISGGSGSVSIPFSPVAMEVLETESKTAGRTVPEIVQLIVNDWIIRRHS